MSFPNTVHVALTACEAPGVYGPFYNGTDAYCVLVDPTGGNRNLVVLKSPDGASWSIQDTGNGPAAYNGTQTTAYTCAQLGTLIYVAYREAASSNTVGLKAFDMSTNTWGADLADRVVNFRTQVGNGFLNLIARTGELVLVTPNNTVTLGTVAHVYPAFTVYDIAGDSWGAFIPLDYEDYVNPTGFFTNWNLIPTGIAYIGGRVFVVSQQVTYEHPTTTQKGFTPASGNIVIPADCSEIFDVVLLGGGGGSGGGGAPAGGGGGAALAASNVPIAVTPGDVIPNTIGLGGNVGADGGDSSFISLSAEGGKTPASTTVGGLGGQASGSSGDIVFSGGNGGSALDTGGAGGGGSGKLTEDGDPGSDSTTPDGGAGGQGFGGLNGGSGGANGEDGLPGNTSCGGGGTGAGVGSPANGVGGSGLLQFSYQGNRTTFDGRLYIQAINDDNTLDALTNIAEGDFPIRVIDTTAAAFFNALSVDLKAFGTKLGIAFTGANATTGFQMVSVGFATAGDTPAFALQLFNVAVYRCTPAIAFDPATGDMGILTTETTTPPVAAFKYRLLSAAGVLGAPATIGTSLLLAGTRAVAAWNVTLNQFSFLFGTPTKSTAQLQSE